LSESRNSDRLPVTIVDVYGRLMQWIVDGGRLPFARVVVDEAQDLPVA